MGILRTCPGCGLESDGLRCPRCNMLKVTGCDGACTSCRTTCDEVPTGAGHANERDARTPAREEDDAISEAGALARHSL